jgi:hypothetical protein
MAVSAGFTVLALSKYSAVPLRMVEVGRVYVSRVFL